MKKLIKSISQALLQESFFNKLFMYTNLIYLLTLIGFLVALLVTWIWKESGLNNVYFYYFRYNSLSRDSKDIILEKFYSKDIKHNSSLSEWAWKKIVEKIKNETLQEGV